MPELETDTTPEKTYTQEYVSALRDEAKASRVAKKAAEAELARARKLIGLKEDEEISDSSIERYLLTVEEKVTKATESGNARLIAAEIKSLDGYDAKLVDRLLDRSKVKIDEAGKVTGLKEAVEAMVTEFPQIKKTVVPPAGSPANPPPPAVVTEVEKLKTQYAEAEKRKDGVAMMSIMSQIKAIK